MKRILIVLAAALMLAACTSRTEHGDCVGIGEDKDPKLTYKLDTTNLVLGIVFVETIVVPVIVAVNETFCPVGKK